MSEERTAHLNNNEKWIMRIAVVSSLAAIVCFTWTKWEVEARLRAELNDEERRDWYSGTYDHEKAQAKRRAQQELQQAPPPPPPLPPARLDGFVPALGFEGPREGMIFKTDALGLGYYRDQPLHERVAEAGQ